jgi:uncharacterized protein
MKHQVCHVEFMSNDLAQTSEFFSKLFGWQLTPMGAEYTLWSAGAGTLGGGFAKHDPAVYGPEGNRTVAYIAVEDIEAKCALIASLGGTVLVPKTKISDEYGFFAIFRDPQGTVVGLWSQA